MRIEGIQAASAIRRMPVVARLRGVARAGQVDHADQSRNRMIAAANGAPNAEAAAPIRRLSRDERITLEQVLGAKAVGTPRAVATGAAVSPTDPASDAARPAASLHTAGPPPSIPITPADPPSAANRAAAREERGLAASRAYARTAATPQPGARFDIVA